MMLSPEPPGTPEDMVRTGPTFLYKCVADFRAKGLSFCQAVLQKYIVAQSVLYPATGTQCAIEHRR
uniref:Uncharacterized protein n=1 Tax=Anguilla anguilla TaxID=7936 RepID=A0A0E9W3Z0_ANGAN